MHSSETIERALRMRAAGATPTEIARLTGVPRRTVNDWWLGRLPLVRPTPPRVPESGYSYLLGLYLGDGWISAHPRGVLKFRLALDRHYPGIINEAKVAIRAVLGDGSVNTTNRPRNCVEVYAYSRRWVELFPQHGSGRKHERPVILEAWQRRIVTAHPERLLRGLVHSDGCRSINTGTNWTHPRYSFSNRSADIRAIFADACDRVGLRWTEAPHTVYVSRKADVARMDEFVGPKY